MPIIKETSARLVKQKIPYEIFSRDVVQSITNPTALAIYAYLMTKPEGWIVRRQDIINHFDGLGRERYADAMRHLKELGLYWVANIQDSSGRITDRVVMIEAVPQPPKDGKPLCTETPTLGEVGHIEIQRLPRDTENNIYIGFKPPTIQEVESYTSTRPTPIDSEKFIDFYQSKGWMVGKNKMKDWQAAVRNWEKNNANTKGNTGQPVNKGRLSPGDRTRQLREQQRQRERNPL